MSERHDPWRWERLSNVAGELGVSARTLQLWCKGDAPGYRPALAHRWVGKRIQVQPAAAYEHLRQYSQKLALQAPAGLEKIAFSPTTPPSGTMTLEDLARNPDLVREHGPEVARVLVSAHRELRQAAGDRVKASTLLTPEEFTKGLRAAARLFVSHVDEIGARRCAARVLGYIRKHFGVDLAAQNPAAVAMIERELREDHNCSLKEFCREIEDRCRGVRLLEGLAPETEAVQPSASEGHAG